MSAVRTAEAVPAAVGAPETTENNRENEIVRDKKHIPIVAAATAVKPLSSLYAEVTLFMKQAASRAIPICSRCGGHEIKVVALTRGDLQDTL